MYAFYACSFDVKMEMKQSCEVTGKQWSAVCAHHLLLTKQQNDYQQILINHTTLEKLS